MGVEIRLARPAEYAAVGQVTVEAYRGDSLLDADTGYADHLADAGARARDAELYVAVDGDDQRILGTVTYCRPGTPFAEVSTEGEGEFRMLAVPPEARRRGVARRLVEHCVARSRELDLEAVVLCSMREMTSAHRLYQGLGFERVPERDWTPAPGVDLQAFRLSLTSTTTTAPCVRPAGP